MKDPYNIHCVFIRYPDNGGKCSVLDNDFIQPGERTADEIEAELNLLRQDGWEILEYSASPRKSSHYQVKEVYLRKKRDTRT